jgi:hypothetical protein
VFGYVDQLGDFYDIEEDGPHKSHPDQVSYIGAAKTCPPMRVVDVPDNAFKSGAIPMCMDLAKKGMVTANWSSECIKYPGYNLQMFGV